MNGTVRIYRPTNRKLVLSVRKLLSDLCDLCVNNFTDFAHFSLRSNIDFRKLLSTRNCSDIEAKSYVLDFFMRKNSGKILFEMRLQNHSQQ